MVWKAASAEAPKAVHAWMDCLGGGSPPFGGPASKAPKENGGMAASEGVDPRPLVEGGEGRFLLPREHRSSPRRGGSPPLGGPASGVGKTPAR